MLTQERLKEVLYYNPETGNFTNNVRRANRHAGERAGCVNALGYIKVSVDGKQYLGHRLAWLYVYGEMPKQIDHINCERSDNRIANLRPCNDKLNHQNVVRAHKDSTSGKLGAYCYGKKGRFRSRIMVDGKAQHLGCFDSIEAAHKAYVAAKAQIHPFSTLHV
jgi:hypothetical protein